MAAGVRVSFESVGLNAEEYQRFIDAGSRAQTWCKSVLRSVAASPDVTPS